jgi:hypothetical protein
MKVPIGGSLFGVREVAGPLVREGKRFAVRICYDRREILILQGMTESQKRDVLAAAVSEAALQRRVPVVFPRWETSVM